MSFEWNCDEDLFPSDNSWSRQSDPEQPPPPLSLRVFETGETIAAASSRSQTNRIQQSQSRSRTRIDMSGRTTDMTRRKTETTMETTDTSSDEGTEEEKVGICGFFCCICPLPCLRVLLTIMVLGAVFGMGILVGSKIRQGSPNFSSNAEVSNSSSGPFQNSTSVQGPYLVGVYYYPWHGNNFHNGDGYIRNQLQPPQHPTLGEYDDSKSETITQHLAWSRQANIGLWVTSWWGPNRLEDTNTRDVIMEHENLGNLKIALHYETTGRIRGEDMSNVKSDIEYICGNYFYHPNYYRIDDRPVIVIYVSRKLEAMGLMDKAITTMRSTASKCGHNIYLVGDHVFRDAPSQDESGIYMPFVYFDAVTNYDVYGSMGSPTYYAGADVVDSYFKDQHDWRSQAISSGCRFIPAVSPGFNDRGVRLQVDHPPLSRRLTPYSEPGSLFSYSLTKAKKLVDPMVDNLLLVNSFNEWHEDSQIEPALGESTTLPYNLTGGVEYQGYGELYLDILRESTL